MRNTTHLGLKVWSNPDDPYDHNELAANWDAIDADDHSTHPIPGAGLQSGSVSTGKLVDGSVTRPKIDPSVLASLQAPLGTMTPFFRPVAGIPIPTGYAIADGRSLGPGSHDWGAITVTLPDLRNKFVLGAATSGTGTTPSTPPAELAVGGLHTRDLSHQHTIQPHSHPHSHIVGGHSHTISNHSHSIALGGTHNHDFLNNDGSGGHGPLWTRELGTSINENAPTLHATVAGYGTKTMYHPGSDGDPGNIGERMEAVEMANAPQHNHGGATGSAGGQTVSVGDSGTTADNTSSGVLTTNSASGSTDLRPGYIGLLWIVKVKNA